MPPENKPLPAIIFDFGGVLIDWNPRHLYCKLFNGDLEAVERFLEEIHFNAWNLEQDAGRSFAQAVAEHCARFPQYCDLIRLYDERWEESLGGLIQPSIDILHGLKQAGYPLYGLSNWSAEKYHLVRGKFEFMDWFKDIVISGEVGLIKPDPRIFNLTRERIGRPAQECLLVDDSATNVEVARRLGFQVIHFRSPVHLAQELQALGVKC